MKGGMARPVLAVVTFAVGLVVVASVVSYSLVYPSLAVKKTFQSPGNNLIYSTKNDVILILNLAFYGAGNVTVERVEVKGDSGYYPLPVGEQMSTGQKRRMVLHLGSDALGDFTENSVYEVKIKTSIGTFTVSAIYVGSAYMVARSAEWAQYMRDPTNSGSYGGPSPRVREVKKTVKRHFLNGFYLSAPSIGYGYLWYGVDDGSYTELVRVNLENLSYEVYPYRGSSYFSPISGNGLIYSAYFSEIYAIDPISGSEVWSREFTCADYIETGALRGGSLFVPVALRNGTTAVYALDPGTGEILDVTWVEGMVITAITAAEGRLAFGTYEGYVYILDSTTLDVVSQVDVQGCLHWDYALAASGGLLAVPVDYCGDTGIYVIDLSSGALVRETWIEGLQPTSNGVAIGGHFYIALHHPCGPNKAKILDYNLETGNYEIREILLGGCGCGGVHYISGLAYSGTSLYAVSSKSEKVLMRIDLRSWDVEYVKIKMKYPMPPVIYNGVYVIGKKGGYGNPLIVVSRIA